MMTDKLPENISGERYIRKLFELSKQLIISLDLDTILQTTVEGVTQISGLDTAAIYLLNERTMRLSATTPPLPPEFPEALRLGVLDDYPNLRRSIDTSGPVFLHDVEEVPGTPAEMAIVQLRNLRTLLFLPLIAENEVLGALIIGSIGKPSPVEQLDRDLAFTFANFAALAVKNALLFNDGQAYAAELERTLSERKKAEEEREILREQLLQAHKMDAIGQLAGGIAHDFNNMLTGIIGNAELLRDSLTDSVLRDSALDIIEIGKRSAELTTQLLAFSRKGQIQNIPVDLNHSVKEVVSILKHTIKRMIEIRVESGSDPVYTMGDPAQIQSALLNLAVNARDAMPDGGLLELRTAIVDLDEEYCRDHGIALPPGRYNEVSVRDTGNGMDAQTIRHIYEPFFTTKKQGEGTGMGLAAVYGTMQTHHGAISVSSTRGGGTTFKLHFPVITAGKEEIIRLADARTPVSGNMNTTDKSRKILVIDDEEKIVLVVAEHLRKTGYEVSTYTDGLSALEFYREYFDSVSLVILDIIMPKTDGKYLFYALRKLKPELSVILTSGYSLTGITQELLNHEGVQFLPKPFLREELLQAVGKVLQL
ncbi:MAG: response regulator [Chitinispirillaceae bacterium]|nr:response regulator [Chitinispirillaceae bacterium]